MHVVWREFQKSKRIDSSHAGNKALHKGHFAGTDLVMAEWKWRGQGQDKEQLRGQFGFVMSGEGGKVLVLFFLFLKAKWSVRNIFSYLVNGLESKVNLPQVLMKCFVQCHWCPF